TLTDLDCESKHFSTRVEGERRKRSVATGCTKQKTAEKGRGSFYLRPTEYTARRERGGHRPERKNRRNRPDFRIEHRQGRIGLSHRPAGERNATDRLSRVESVGSHRYARCRSRVRPLRSSARRH